MKDEKLKYSCFEPLPPNDAQWIRELKQGNAEATRCLWVNTYIYAENIPRFRSVEADIKHDAARQAYLRLIDRGIHRFSFRGPFCGYICWVVINRIKSGLQAQPPPEAPLPPDIDETLGEYDAGFARLEEQQVEEARQAALEECLRQLAQTNPLRHAVIRLFYFDNVEVDEIAARLGKNRNAIHQLLHNARRELKECLRQAEA